MAAELSCPSNAREDVSAASAVEQATPPTGEQPAAGAAAEPPATPIDADNLDEAFVKALEDDFFKNGPTAIAAMRSEKPTEYMKLIAAVRGKDPNDATNRVREMSDEELDRCIQELAARAGYDIRPAAAPARESAADAQGGDAD